ncbi:MAG: GyrI-like domain-containing protein [Anaerolineae bacterium]|nr:GyrI-like domain-containing protein [Anaerolineae bacterium]
MAAKLDLKKGEYKHLYFPPADDVVQVDVPAFHFVMLSSEGYPGTSQAWADAMGALYGVSYKIKFLSKKTGIDYTVMPLEGLWWTDDMRQFNMENKDIWKWTAMIMQPEHVTEAMFRAGVEGVHKSKKASPLLDQVRFEVYHEGLSAQIMHLGPYADEAPTVKKLHEWIIANGYTYHGAKHHHEIYLSDPSRVTPENMKTVIRQPMIPA